MNKIKESFLSLFHKFFSPLRHPVKSARAYAAEMRALDTKGRVIKLLKTLGFVLGLIAFVFVCYYVAVLAITLVLGIFLTKVIIGGGIFERRYNRMVKEDCCSEYYYEK